MQLIKVAGNSAPARVAESGWRRDVVIGHRLTGGPLMVHSPDQACSWCALTPDAVGPLTDALKGDRTTLMAGH
jgi:hypothetical protein